MKKTLNILTKIILIITILILTFVIVSNLITLFRILFIGISVGNPNYPETIWYQGQVLKGFSGIKTYYTTLKELFIYIELPIAILCIIYQIIYNKIIRKKV